MNQVQTDIATDFYEDYSPKGHLYLQNDGSLDWSIQKEFAAQNRTFVGDIITGYSEAFKELYSLVKKTASQVKDYFGRNVVAGKSAQKNNGSIDDLIEASSLDSEQARFLLMTALQKQVSENVNKYFSENSYDDTLVTKVKTAYDFAVKNSTLALSKEEVMGALTDVMGQDQNLESSSVLRTYANRFVNNTVSDTLAKNREIQGKYSIPRMNLKVYSDPVLIN